MSNKNKLHFEYINRQSFSFSTPVNLSLKHPQDKLQTQLTVFNSEGLCEGFSVFGGVVEGVHGKNGLGICPAKSVREKSLKLLIFSITKG